MIGGYLTPQQRVEFYKNGKSRLAGRLDPEEKTCTKLVYHSVSELRTGMIQSRIEKLRGLMIEMGLEMGLTHPAVIKISECIDELHNELTRITLGRN